MTTTTPETTIEPAIGGHAFDGRLPPRLPSLVAGLVVLMLLPVSALTVGGAVVVASAYLVAIVSLTIARVAVRVRVLDELRHRLEDER